MEAQQSGHIEGAFTSKAVTGKVSKIRSSNYGNEYDLNMQAKKDASGSSATGNLGYYVDGNNPLANRIQGAVDASESGDSVNVAPGTYYENVQIDKSLTVKGAGASETIVDGQQSGSVFTVGKNNPDITVTLSDMAIQGGTGTSTDLGEDGHTGRRRNLECRPSDGCPQHHIREQCLQWRWHLQLQWHGESREWLY